MKKEKEENMFEAQRKIAIEKINQSHRTKQIIEIINNNKYFFDYYIYKTYYKGKPSKDDIKNNKKDVNTHWGFITSVSNVQGNIEFVLKCIREYEKEDRILYRKGKLFTIEDAFANFSLALWKTSEFILTDKLYKCSFKEFKGYCLTWFDLEDKISTISNNLSMAD
jgi:hypothetical protein